MSWLDVVGNVFWPALAGVALGTLIGIYGVLVRILRALEARP